MPSDPSPLVRYVEQCATDSKEFFPGTSQSLPFMVLAMAGEVGELANIVKKIERGSLDPRSAAVKRELAMEATDIFIYLMNTFYVLGVDPGKAYEMKRTENVRRFGNPAV
jgi:NTP pyrophosphatase (non-canonical NTP hydrolase)